MRALTQTMAFRALLWVGGSALVLTGLIGLMHIPAARGLLARTGIRWGCPIPRATPEQTEAAFMNATRPHLGTTTAAVRPAAGFALGSSTADAAFAQLKAQGVTCTTKDRGFHYVRCENVPASVIGDTGAPIQVLTLVFDRTEKLLSVDVWRAGMSEADGARMFDERVASLHEQLGTEPSQVTAAKTLALSLSHSSAEFQFTNYLAKLSATNIPGKGIAVREQYTDTSRM